MPIFYDCRIEYLCFRLLRHFLHISFWDHDEKILLFWWIALKAVSSSSRFVKLRCSFSVHGTLHFSHNNSRIYCFSWAIYVNQKSAGIVKHLLQDAVWNTNYDALGWCGREEKGYWVIMTPEQSLIDWVIEANLNLTLNWLTINH